MKITLPQHQYFDIAGNPLVAGRLRVYMHDSADPATLYTLSGDIYTEAPNPVILDNSGEITDTVWFDAAIVDVKVDAANGDGTYREISEFETGFTMPTARDDKVVDGIDGLRLANPELGTVTVDGYDGNCHAPARRFVYDPECTVAEDGGCIFESSVEGATGRWILVHADEKIPCTFYGVVPGHEANLAAMMNIPESVGQWSIQLPKIPRMLPGEYTSSTTYSTSKTLYFDKGARFGNASFICNSVMCPQTDRWLAKDINCTGKAHSSWFRTVEDFWTCGASILIVDPTNYFENTTVSHAISLAGKHVVGNGTLVTAYYNSAYFTVNLTSDIPDNFFTASDYVKVDSDLGDAMWRDAGAWDPGLISAGHHVQYVVAPSLTKFASADRWLSVMLERRDRLSSLAWNQYTIDLLGRSVSGFTLSATSFSNILNANVNGQIMVRRDVALDNVKATLLTDGSDLAITALNSNLTFSQDCTGIYRVILTDCTTEVQGQAGFDPAETLVAVNGGHFAGNIKLSDAHADTYTPANPVNFRGVVIEGVRNWRVHSLSMVDCYGDVKIDSLPAAASNNFYWNIVLEGNTFIGASRVWFGIYADANHPHSELNGKCLFNTCRIVNNRFDGANAWGIMQLHWHPVTQTALLADGSACEYHGNSGNCPRLTPGYVPNTNRWPTTQGTNPKWRLFDGSFNIWCPYLTYGDGSVAPAQDNTGLNPTMANAPYALYFTSTITDDIGHYLYGYRTFYGLSDLISNNWLNDETKNNTFSVMLAMGVGGPSVPAFNDGTTLFPGIDVV